MKVSSEMKVLFIEQHSMKLNQGTFYTLESTRQNYLMAWETYPYLGGVGALAAFILFAIRTPLHAKLYKEAFYSLGLGMTGALAYPFY